MLLLMWRKDKYYVLHGMTLNWWFTFQTTKIGVGCLRTNITLFVNVRNTV